MLRFVTILIGLFNLFGTFRGWLAALSFPLGPLWTLLGNIIPENIEKGIAIVLIIGMLLFLIIHSLRLILFHESARKIQVIISLADPFIRLITIFFIIYSNIENMPPKSAIIASFIITTFIDIFIIYYLQRQKNKDIFHQAEEDRDQKFRMKLMKNK